MYEQDLKHARMSGMSEEGAVRYAERIGAVRDRQLLVALDRASAVGALDAWASGHELGAVHLQRRTNMVTAEPVYQVVLTARDSLDLVSGWRSTPDEARADMVAALGAEAPALPVGKETE